MPCIITLFIYYVIAFYFNALLENKFLSLLAYIKKLTHASTLTVNPSN